MGTYICSCLNRTLGGMGGRLVEGLGSLGSNLGFFRI